MEVSNQGPCVGTYALPGVGGGQMPGAPGLEGSTKSTIHCLLQHPLWHSVYWSTNLRPTSLPGHAEGHGSLRMPSKDVKISHPHVKLEMVFFSLWRLYKPFRDLGRLFSLYRGDGGLVGSGWGQTCSHSPMWQRGQDHLLLGLGQPVYYLKIIQFKKHILELWNKKNLFSMVGLRSLVDTQ